jgi:TRAP transporter 4TM/12TM fusion protein
MKISTEKTAMEEPTRGHIDQTATKTPRIKKFADLLAGVFAIYTIVTISGIPTLVGWFPPNAQLMAIGLIFALTLVYLTVPSNRKTGETSRVRDILFLVPGLIGAGFAAFFYESKIVPYTMFGYLDTLGIVMTLALAVSLIEALRRVIGWVLPILILAIVAMTYWQEYLPGLLSGTGFDLSRLTFAAYVGGGGIFGTPFTIAMSIIIVFLIFGSLLEKSGGGQWFMDVANSLTGWSRGGTAKTSVVASALFGSVSGSPSGNTATTGAVTIPAMRKSGYSRNFSGAVEAVASTGGMILPPVMGAVAFIMADLLGISYAAVVKAAIIPALLYFIILFSSVHFRALRQGMQGTPRKELPPVLRTFLTGWRYWGPIAALTYFLVVMQLSPGIAGLYSLPFLIGFSFFTGDRSLWLTPRNIWAALVAAVYRWRLIAVVTASVGIMLGALNLSGLGVKVSSFIVELGGGNLLLTLLLVGVASLILGMGLDIIPLYLTLVVLTAPALVDLGLTPTQAHLFVIFWGLASFITPPVCNAVYAACAISGGDVWRTGGEAVRLGAAVFLVSFAFALSPALMMEGHPAAVLFAVGTALLGALLVAAGLQGYGLWSMNLPQRILFVAAGALLLAPSAVGAIIAAVLISIALLWGLVQKQRAAPLTAHMQH